MIATVPGEGGATLFLRTTFGILVSRDRGKSFRWMCERALGYEGQWDPPIAVTRDGTLWVGLEGGLASTRDGCAVEAAPELGGETVRDLTTDARGETLWAISGVPGKPSHVFRKRLGGGWERLAAAGLEGVNVMTIEVAPGAPSRLYVSGQPYDTIRGRLYRSDDGGKTFTGAENALAAEGPFFIAAVDAADPSRVILRHLHTTGSDVLVTTDGGRTFRTTLSMKSAMFGFAKADGGKTLWAGSGLPEHGIVRSTDGGETWARVAERGVLCLHAPPAPAGTLFACENVLALGASAAAVSDDRGSAWRSLGTFAEVLGPVRCEGARVDAGGALCAAAAWDEIRAFVSPRVDPVVVDASAPVAPSVDAGRAEPAARASRACACDVVGAPRGMDLGWLIAGACALALRGRSRSGNGSPPLQGRARRPDRARTFR